MKTALLGFFTALVLFASAAAHALVGWPQLRRSLDAAGLDAAVIGALAVGWIFGSASMLAFGGIVVHQAVRRSRGREVHPAPLGVISVVYLVYGLSAYLLRDLNPHFLLFVVTGVLVGLFAYLGARSM